jgi:2-methylisocitrate lyase-like PEP mutase family enzyme
VSASSGSRLRARVAEGDLLPLIGVYDVFSAALAARHFEGVFVSGFSFAGSHYGLPDIGFIAWPDIVAFTRRIRTVLPAHHVMVDIDDGYCDPEVAAHVVSVLEAEGASGVVLEDQARPRRCGHYDGKQLLSLDQFVAKLEKVLGARRELFVVARTDAQDHDEVLRRALAFEAAGADAILVEAVRDLDTLAELSAHVSRPLVFNQIAGGKSPSLSWAELRAAGVGLVHYSTPCLFAAQGAIDRTLSSLRANDGRLPDRGSGDAVLSECSALLYQNLRGGTK